jgi:hypothetical protein
MEIVGAILYTGVDPAGRQLSAIFGGSENVLKLINGHETNVRSTLDWLTMLVKYDISYTQYASADIYSRIRSMQELGLSLLIGKIPMRFPMRFPMHRKVSNALESFPSNCPYIEKFLMQFITQFSMHWISHSLSSCKSHWNIYSYNAINNTSQHFLSSCSHDLISYLRTL